eukprot:1160896-Pelagomonas_calceolata.AAC.4
MTATISIRPCPPVRDFVHEGWTRLGRGEALALIESRHVTVAGACSQAGLCLFIWILAAVSQAAIVCRSQVCMDRETWISSDEFGIRVGHQVSSPNREEHKSSSCLCVENGGVDKMLQGLGQNLLIMNGMADSEI